MAGWVARKITRRCNFRKKAGSVCILANEVYLRDDIVCGSPLCRSCASDLARLPSDASHYLVPSADAITQLWEILELVQVSAVVYLSSVLKKVQQRTTVRGWRRLKHIFTDRRRCNIVFDDEHCLYTSLTFDQASSDYLQQLAEWFYDHLEGAVPVVLLTGFDTNAATLCSSVEVLDPDTYFRKYWEHDSSVTELFVSLALTYSESRQTEDPNRVDGIPGGSKTAFKEHLSGTTLEAGIASGLFRVGVYSVTKHNSSEAYVRPSNKGEASRLEVLVRGWPKQNRALHGDTVAVKITRDSLQSTERTNNDSFSLNADVDDIIDEEHHEAESLLTGEIVGILQRVQRDYVACLAEEDAGNLANSARQERLLCIPMDRRVPMVELTTRHGMRLSKQRFVLRIHNWEADWKLPRAHLVRELGPIGNLNTETMAILVENGISDAPFSSLSLQELPEDRPERPWTIPPSEYAIRRDIRASHRCCSIDPPGSRDVDDVLSVNYLENGLVEVGVHIADVSYFVKPGSLLDLEAKARGTTVYMVGKSWHMLPATLSENLCSLLEGKDRLAVSVIWTLDASRGWEVVATWFGKTVICSKHQLFYAQAEAILEGKPLRNGWEIRGGDAKEIGNLQKDLKVLAAFARNRRNFRKRDGALELASTELRFQVDERNEPVQVETKSELPMNWIVAEMMIFANSCVAEKIYSTSQSCSLLRKHMPPKLDSFTMIFECCQARGINLDVSSNKALAASLDRISATGDFALERAFRSLITRAMSEAEYFSTGSDLEPSHYRHYGLALNYYTHFTSPIRRYADVLVHRMLIAACQNNVENAVAPVLSPTELQEVAEHLNEKHRASKRAQKECNELYLLTYLQKEAKAERGVIIKLTSNGFMVFIPKFDLRGPVYLKDKKGQIILPDRGAQQPAPQVYDVVKNQTSVKIVYVPGGRAAYEYRLMDTVWVRLTADGSRAHGPTMRMELLDERDPAVLAAETQEISDSVFHLDLSKLEDESRKLVASSQRNKAIKAMIEMVDAETVGRKTIDRPKRDVTVSDVLENIAHAKTSYLFTDAENSDTNAFTKLVSNTYGDLHGTTQAEIELTGPAIDTETHSQFIFRKRWQEALGMAGNLKAKLTTSASANRSERQQIRAAKEFRARNKAEAERIMMQSAREHNTDDCHI